MSVAAVVVRIIQLARRPKSVPVRVNLFAHDVRVLVPIMGVGTNDLRLREIRTRICLAPQTPVNWKLGRQLGQGISRFLHRSSNPSISSRGIRESLSLLRCGQRQ